MPGTLVERGWLTLFLVTFIFILPHLLNLLSLWIFSPSHMQCPWSTLYLRYNIPPFLDCHKRANQIKPNMTNNKAHRKILKYKKFFFFFNIKVWGDGKGAHHKGNLKWYFRHLVKCEFCQVRSASPYPVAQLPLLEENKTTRGHLNWLMQNRATPCSHWPKLGSRLALYTQNSLLCPTLMSPSLINIFEKEREK